MVAEDKGSGYKAGPPWVFKGRALYQLHLVRTDVARKLIPEQLSLVDFFGYTLGGIFLAQYDSSPAGKFDELVVLAGIVWNPPTSCAWASRVVVNSPVARDHGRKEVGLPSQLATFSKRGFCLQKDRPKWWQLNRWMPFRGGGKQSGSEQLGTPPPSRLLVDISREGAKRAQQPWCRVVLPPDNPGWKGPKLHLPLPNFSGHTASQPDLLHYTCDLRCRIRPTSAADVSVLKRETGEDDIEEVLRSRPLFTLEFGDMEMYVQAPTVVNKQPSGGKSRPPPLVPAA